MASNANQQIHNGEVGFNRPLELQLFFAIKCTQALFTIVQEDLYDGFSATDVFVKNKGTGYTYNDLIMLPGYGQRVAFVKAYLSLQSHFLWY
jgi:hypothetical protein